MEEQKISFIRTGFLELLKKAEPSVAPAWGKMSFQQMVEHMVLVFKNANGKLKQEIVTPADKLELMRAFMMGPKEFRENTKSPVFPEEPLPLHFPNSLAALAKLETEIAHFFEVYQRDPELLIRNPVFGDLNYEESLTLLYKHTRHHARQFGLIQDTKH
ncbi:MAG: hypothetical protein H7Y27_05430 [Gemmatimonadaceae bacterium]|nr:hypothetical protein [Chitinophagaceae bacterium]